jgi:antitoxin MazE
MRVSKWGNSLGVRLPREIVTELQLQEGDEITFSVVPDLHTIGVSRLASPEELLQQLRAQRRRAPKGFRFNRDDANARR